MLSNRKALLSFVVLLLCIAGYAILRSAGSMKSAAPALDDDEAIGAPPHTPAEGSAERKAIIDAVRLAVGNSTQYRVSWLRATPRWAFFEGTEVVPLERGEVQETDLTVEALLERRIGADVAWEVVEKWELPSDDSAPRAAFLSAMRSRMRRDALPKTLFPRDPFQ